MDKYLNGYAQLTSFKWHSEKAFKYAEYVYEGRVREGVSQWEGFGRLSEGADNQITVGYFQGFKTIQGKFI